VLSLVKGEAKRKVLIPNLISETEANETNAAVKGICVILNFWRARSGQGTNASDARWLKGNAEMAKAESRSGKSLYGV
jgi:hypothetical protein